MTSLLSFEMILQLRNITRKHLYPSLTFQRGQKLRRNFSSKQDKDPTSTGSSSGAELGKKVSRILGDVSAKVHKKGGAIMSTSFHKVKGSISAFDDVLGISEVRDAQSKVRETEDEFTSTRKRVQTAKKELEFVHTRLADVRKRLDRTPRDDERYLALATEEHRILLEEKKLKVDYEELENHERDLFAALSGMVRDSHEKERARAERTKYWSIVGSVMGAALGMIGSSVMNYIRLKEIKNSVKGTGHSLMEKSDELRDMITSQDSKLAKHNSDLQESVATQSQEIADRLSEIRDAVDTYALSASIGSDIGTIEAGISLKTLTTQLRELVQLQLASARNEVEQNSEKSLPELQSLLEQVDMRQSEMRSMFLELFVKVEEIYKNVETRGKQLESIGNNRNYEDEILEPTSRVNDFIVKTHQSMDNTRWWVNMSTIASLSCALVSLAATVYDIYK